MFKPDTILQRTENGRNEIYEKKQGLTQSERLVLIMIDGISPCRDIRGKLPVLTEERLHRALTTLYNKDLISEILLPLAGQEAEQLERTAVERFLQQDPLDPVTIISLNPEEEFGIPLGSSAAASPQTPAAQASFSRPDTTWYATTSAYAPDTQSLASSHAPVPAEVASAENGYSTLDRAMAELNLTNGATPAPGVFAGQGGYAEDFARPSGWRKLLPDRQGVYLIIGFSLVFIGGFLLGRATG